MTTATAADRGEHRPRPIAEALAGSWFIPITVEQYQRMIEEGIVPEDATVELLHGALVRKDRSIVGEDPMGHSPLHVLVVSLLEALARKIDSERWHMKTQLPVACPPDGAPEPDASIIRGRIRDYATRLPGPGDVTCVIEAAHSSLDRDREDKAPIYARAGIPQYVIINLQDMTVEVHSEPDREREAYQSHAVFSKGQSIELLLPEGTFGVDAAELLP